MFVFMAMPFAITEVYDDIIKPLLEIEKCEIKRADEPIIQGHIVRDIMQYLYQADLVIADLTGLNPNVFYELAIAHALRKPHFLITQDDPNNLPFDLKSYRVLQYSYHHKQVDELKSGLRQTIQ